MEFDELNLGYAFDEDDDEDSGDEDNGDNDDWEY